jgi:hypothetical protein
MEWLDEQAGHSEKHQKMGDGAEFLAFSTDGTAFPQGLLVF